MQSVQPLCSLVPSVGTEVQTVEPEVQSVQPLCSLVPSVEPDEQTVEREVQSAPPLCSRVTSYPWSAAEFALYRIV